MARDREKRLEAQRRYRKKLKERAKSIFGEECHICDKIRKRMCYHRKDGKEHIPKYYNGGGWKSLHDALREPNKFAYVCYGCHKAIHWCMNILGWDWNKIISEVGG